MDTVLGLLGLLLFVVGVIALAAGVTWVVVRFIPAERAPKEPSA